MEPQITNPNPNSPPSLDSLVGEQLVREDYEMEQRIGGGFSTHFIAVARKLNAKRVIVKLEHLDDGDSKIGLATELYILRTTHHPNIVQFLGAYRQNNEVWKVFELLDGAKLSEFEGSLSENQIAMVSSNILKVLNYFHGLFRIHRDIRCSHVLLTVYGEVKLIDFGVATWVTDSEPLARDVLGSPYWMAPEILNRGAYGTKVDIWSFGVSLREMLEGHPPYYEIAPIRAMFAIISKGLPPLAAPEKHSEQVKDLLQQCLIVDPVHRPTAKDLLQHPFLLQACSVAELARVVRVKMKEKVITVESSS